MLLVFGAEQSVSRRATDNDTPSYTITSAPDKRTNTPSPRQITGCRRLCHVWRLPSRRRHDNVSPRFEASTVSAFDPGESTTILISLSPRSARFVGFNVLQKKKTKLVVSSHFKNNNESDNFFPQLACWLYFNNRLWILLTNKWQWKCFLFFHSSFKYFFWHKTVRFLLKLRKYHVYKTPYYSYNVSSIGFPYVIDFTLYKRIVSGWQDTFYFKSFNFN